MDSQSIVPVYENKVIKYNIYLIFQLIFQYRSFAVTLLGKNQTRRVTYLGLQEKSLQFESSNVFSLKIKLSR